MSDSSFLSLTDCTHVASAMAVDVAVCKVMVVTCFVTMACHVASAVAQAFDVCEAFAVVCAMAHAMACAVVCHVAFWPWL